MPPMLSYILQKEVS